MSYTGEKKVALLVQFHRRKTKMRSLDVDFSKVFNRADHNIYYSSCTCSIRGRIVRYIPLTRAESHISLRSSNLKERISTAIRIASYPVADKHWSTSEFYNDIFNFQTGVADLQRQI